MLRWDFPEPSLGCAPELGVGSLGKIETALYVCMLNSFLIAFDTGEHLLFLSVFRGFWWVVYHEYHLGCNLLSRFYWLAGWLAFRLDFMWLIGSHRNRRHPVKPHARSSFVVDRNVPRFANLDECFHCSKFLQPLWLILAMKKSLSSVMGADLK